MIRGSFIILLFLFIGESISYFIDKIVPGSVIGMVLIFISLTLKIIKPEQVRSVTEFLTKNMTIFFVPASIGLMKSWNIISANWFSLTFICISSTILIIIIVALIQENAEKLNKKRKKNAQNIIDK